MTSFLGASNIGAYSNLTAVSFHPWDVVVHVYMVCLHLQRPLKHQSSWMPPVKEEIEMVCCCSMVYSVFVCLHICGPYRLQIALQRKQQDGDFMRGHHTSTVIITPLVCSM